MLSNTPRISSGDLRNRKLKLPRSNPNLRFVRDMIRQAVFMIIGDKIEGSQVLDLFSGTGVLGFEAISRGADFVDFVDENKSSIEATKENAFALKVDDKVEAHNTKAITYCGNTDKKYDLVFLDPFYEDRHHKFLLQLISDILNPDGLVVFFHGGNDIEDLIKNLNLEVVDERKYSLTIVTFLRNKAK